VHSLWIGNRIPELPARCIESWLLFGYRYHLWVYQDVENVPDGVDLMDGSEIMKEVFLYEDDEHKHHPALQANLFRYKFLLSRGGTWLDADTACLKGLPVEPSVIISSEPLRQPPYYHPNLACIRIPAGSRLMEECHTLAMQRIDAGDRRWGRFGPRMFAPICERLGLYDRRYIVAPEQWCPIPCYLTKEMWTPHNLPFPEQSHGIHIWSVKTTQIGRDADQHPPEDSLVARIWERIYGRSVSFSQPRTLSVQALS
jgi:hypothetical protein